MLLLLLLMLLISTLDPTPLVVLKSSFVPQRRLLLLVMGPLEPHHLSRLPVFALLRAGLESLEAVWVHFGVDCWAVVAGMMQSSVMERFICRSSGSRKEPLTQTANSPQSHFPSLASPEVRHQAKWSAVKAVVGPQRGRDSVSMKTLQRPRHNPHRPSDGLAVGKTILTGAFGRK